jgi:DNA-binding transcriptional ArsR family regulator
MITTSLTQEITRLHADLCSALADPTRLLLLYALSNEPRNVTELTQDLQVPQPTVSRHLKVLREGGLVKASRQGSSVQYQLTDHRVIEALDLLRSILRERIQHDASLIVDR